MLHACGPNVRYRGPYAGQTAGVDGALGGRAVVCQAREHGGQDSAASAAPSPTPSPPLPHSILLPPHLPHCFLPVASIAIKLQPRASNACTSCQPYGPSDFYVGCIPFKKKPHSFQIAAKALLLPRAAAKVI